ncbi:MULTISPECIES: saccharopine dehydrogenase family protein [Psychrobacter]|uniref:saccharopine dehydrogenase family protein n=1 Tax=Psychrobacter TaxID=497 RepID=UPI000C34607D|nr:MULTISPECIES: saccharopine dehydrogenase family protein [Psychrobacter]MBA6243188.1 saccharopine dehydrogenase family protein [Psychrobacter sp. Urea-trap-18]MBA6286246.1 saccharopine dehydrogenase family protein [Psychrobacter sp. Urea-trap-16]MBA6317395.1 saccharopine dehydrogenase family protein [Psychrobacter sp. Urea-trap-20]MBA6334577.1 saccharopine dehydrogenase family protein [Psychrobacter sp. Urea-trap-19]PKG60879.1 saccharopine dehydrogenase [Psychrobacter sp. Choline-3u-12]
MNTNQPVKPNKKDVLIIGAGGVAQVVAHKCAMHNDVLGEIHIASRTKDKCDDIAQSVKEKDSFKQAAVLHTHQVDAMDSQALVQLIKEIEIQIVINVGSAFINMTVLEACIETGVAYIDTAIHEDPRKICETPPWYNNYEWQRKERCADNNVTAILGAGFDPGMVNAYARLGYDMMDAGSVTDIDIIDINAGSHGKYFATNFDPEINFREFTGTVYSWQDSKWQSNKMFEVKRTDDLPVVGVQNSYLSGHDEVHSLSANLDVPNIRFWMGFGEHYINVFTVLQSLGLLSEQPVMTAEGQEVVPLKVVKAVLPDPSSLAPNYTGKTCIGDKVKGKINDVDSEVFIYNVSDHKDAYNEVGSQGISYTAGVPPVAAAILVATGEWDAGKMVNVEELDAKPFINLLNKIGLPTRIKDSEGDRALEFDI